MKIVLYGFQGLLRYVCDGGLRRNICNQSQMDLWAYLFDHQSSILYLRENVNHQPSVNSVFSSLLLSKRYLSETWCQNLFVHICAAF